MAEITKTVGIIPKKEEPKAEKPKAEPKKK